MAGKTAGDGWDRVGVNLRLSKRRLAQLQELAARLPSGATPTDAVDLALGLALNNAGQVAGRLDAMDDAIERSDMERRFEIGRIEAAVKAQTEAVDALRALISEVAASDGS